MVGSQRTFALRWRGVRKGNVTRRERFLAEMDAVIPWPRLLALIEPHYPKAGNGRQPRRWRRCCLATSCSRGSISPIRRAKTRSTTASRCDASREWSWATTWGRMRRPFCVVAIFWSGTA